MKLENSFDDPNFERAQTQHDLTTKTNELLDELTRQTNVKKHLQGAGTPGKLEESQIKDIDNKIAKINAQLSALYSKENN